MPLFFIRIFLPYLQILPFHKQGACLCWVSATFPMFCPILLLPTSPGRLAIPAQLHWLQGTSFPADFTSSWTWIIVFRINNLHCYHHCHHHAFVIASLFSGLWVGAVHDLLWQFYMCTLWMLLNTHKIALRNTVCLKVGIVFCLPVVLWSDGGVFDGGSEGVCVGWYGGNRPRCQMSDTHSSSSLPPPSPPA